MKATPTNPLCHHSHHFDLGTFGTFNPDLFAITHPKVVGVACVDLNEYVLLKFSQPWV